MIKLRNILLEQKESDKLNVLFVTDYPTETIGNFAKRLIATGKVSGEIKSYTKQDSKEALSLVAHNISSEFNLLIVQVSGIRDRSAKDLLNTLNRISTIANRKNIPLLFIATPTTRFSVSDDHDLDFIEQVYNILGRQNKVIELSELTDDSYFQSNGIVLNKTGNQIIYTKVLQYLKTLDNTIEIDSKDSEELETGKDDVNQPNLQNGINNDTADNDAASSPLAANVTQAPSFKDRMVKAAVTAGIGAASAWNSLSSIAADAGLGSNTLSSTDTQGFVSGKVDSGKVTGGGDGGNWGGSMARALKIAKIANTFVGKNIVSSQKRSKVQTANKNTSDHYIGATDAYAVDLSTSGAAGDKLLAHLMQSIGHPEYTGGKWFNVNINGFRYQIGWKVPGHFDHIHIGVKKL